MDTANTAIKTVVVEDNAICLPQFERFVTEFAAALARIADGCVSAEIEKWLTPLVAHMHVDLAMIAPCLTDERFTPTYVTGWPAEVRCGAVDQWFPWISAAARRRKLVVFSGLGELPNKAILDRHNLERFGVKSQISVPLIADGALLGLFSLSSRNADHKWLSEIITRTRLLGSVLANALARQKSRQLQQRMQAQLSDLARIGTASEIAVSLAHELMQPLSAILVNAQAGLRFLAQNRMPADEIGEILHDIVRDDKRASAIIGGLRAMMRRRTGERQTIDMSQLVEETLAMLNMSIQTQNIDVRKHLESGCDVVADRAQLQQVLVNLIVNAIEAMQAADARDRRLFVEVRHGASIQCTVHDTGKDLRPDHLNRIFEPFWTTKTHGLGMGLAISRSIINAHHGVIWAEIAQDGGAVFRFTLPKEAHDAPPSA